MANEIMTIRGMDKDIYLTNGPEKKETLVLGLHKVQHNIKHEGNIVAIMTTAKTLLKSAIQLDHFKLSSNILEIFSKK